MSKEGYRRKTEIKWADLIGAKALIAGIWYRVVRSATKNNEGNVVVQYAVREEHHNSEVRDARKSRYGGELMRVDVTDSDPAGKILKKYFKVAG
jgi:hypothetical protein